MNKLQGGSLPWSDSLVFRHAKKNQPEALLSSYAWIAKCWLYTRREPLSEQTKRFTKFVRDRFRSPFRSSTGEHGLGSSPEPSQSLRTNHVVAVRWYPTASNQFSFNSFNIKKSLSFLSPLSPYFSIKKLGTQFRIKTSASLPCLSTLQWRTRRIHGFPFRGCSSSLRVPIFVRRLNRRSIQTIFLLILPPLVSWFHIKHEIWQKISSSLQSITWLFGNFNSWVIRVFGKYKKNRILKKILGLWAFFVGWRNRG